MLARFTVSASALLACVLGTPARAQCPQWSPPFPGGGFDGTVHHLTAFDDGSGPKLYAGGDFKGAGVELAKHVARWDGSVWAPVGGGFAEPVTSFAVHDDGNGPALYATDGDVWKWNGGSWTRIGLASGDAALLLSFDDGNGAALYAAGEFTQMNGFTAPRFARWDGGATWSGIGSVPTSNGKINALVAHDDGSGAGPRLYCGGTFTGGVARWDGSSWPIIGGGIAKVHSLASYHQVSTGERLLIAGGSFDIGTSHGLASLAAGGSWVGCGQNVFGLHRVLFTHIEQGVTWVYYGGTTGLGRCKPFHTWQSIGSPEPIDGVYALESFDDGSGEALYAAGSFTDLSPGVDDVQRVARWRYSGGWSGLMRGERSLRASSAVYGATVFDLTQWTEPLTGRELLVPAGDFDGSDDAPDASGIAAWDGLAWHALDPATCAGRYAAMTTFHDPATSQELLIAARVTSSSAADAIRKYDGTSWTGLSIDSPRNVKCFAMWQQPGDSLASLFAGGTFNGSPVGLNYIARWDGTSWSALASGLAASCYALEAFDPPGALGPALYIGGNDVYRWDGATLTNTSGGTTMSAVYSFTIFDDGTGPKLWAGDASGKLWSHDGTTWTQVATLSSFGSDVQALAVYDDGSGPAIYSGVGVRYRNGQVESWMSATPTGEVSALHSLVDENSVSRGLFVGGAFEAVDDVPSRFFARWSNPCSSPTSYCTAKINSQGCTPAITWTGEPSIAASATTPFTIAAANVLNQKFGLFFYGVYGRKALAYQGGTLCLRGPYLRTPARSSGGNVGVDDCSGNYAIDFTPWISGVSDPLLEPGITINGQWWSRDPANASTTGLTNAIEFEIRP